MRFGVSLEGDSHELEVTPILELSVTFYEFRGVSFELDNKFYYKLISNFNLEGACRDQKVFLHLNCV
jgi:hypothetical protein